MGFSNRDLFGGQMQAKMGFRVAGGSLWGAWQFCRVFLIGLSRLIYDDFDLVLCRPCGSWHCEV